MMLRYANGARGALWASQVAPGNENGLMLRVYGTKGGVNWRQENPNVHVLVAVPESRRASSPAAARIRARRPRASRACRRAIPRAISKASPTSIRRSRAAIKAARTGKKPPKGVHFPTIDDGVKGIAFVEAAVKSSKANGKWVKL